MATTTQAPGVSQDTVPAPAEPAASRRQGNEPKDYYVFEAEGDMAKLKPGDTVTFLGMFNATTTKEARWAAVDKTKSLQAKVKVKAGEAGGAYLLPVAVRNAKVELTREEVVETSVRK